MSILEAIIRGRDELTPVLQTAGASVGTFANTANENMKTFGQSLTDIGGSMRNFGTALSVGVTGPLALIGTASVNAASDLAETTSKVGVLFDDQAGAIQDWAATAAEGFGQSKTQAMDAAAQFAIFGEAAGLSGKDLTGFSTRMVELASDLASFNNTTPEEAIVAIGAALRGESEPIRKYGVLLNEAALQSEGFKLGIVASTDEALTPQQRVLAAQSLILKETTEAQGDFSRTSEGLANQQRILKAKLGDTSAELGEKLLPIALRIVETVDGWIDRFDNLSPRTQTFITYAGLIAAALGPVIATIGTVISVVGTVVGAMGGASAVAGVLGTAIAAIGGPITIAIGAIGLLSAAWIGNWGGIKDKTMEIVGSIGETLSGWGESISTWWSERWSSLKGQAEESGGWFSLFKEKAGDALSGVRERATEWAIAVSDSFSGVKSKIGEWKDALVEWFGNVQTELGKIDWEQFGTDTISGITRGIILAPFSIADAVEAGFSEAAARIKEKLGMNSPSKVAAREIGLPFAQGIAVGVRTGMPAVMREVTNNNYWSVQVMGGGGAAQGVLNSVQLLSALYA